MIKVDLPKVQVVQFHQEDQKSQEVPKSDNPFESNVVNCQRSLQHFQVDQVVQDLQLLPDEAQL